jgi:hypothetical protein|tara:strand:+ start:56598 stop:56888 length:291 start_codon:yes stop_codon:yes gene_type:complete
MRSVVTVLEGMHNILTTKYNGIIEENEKASDLHRAFNKIRISMSYAAPELLIGESSFQYFHKITNILNHYISHDDYIQYPWCRDIIDIFQDPNYGK